MSPDDEELLRQLREALAPEPREVDPSRVAALRADAEARQAARASSQAAATAPRHSPGPVPRGRGFRLRWGLAAAAGLVIAVAGGFAIGQAGSGEDGPDAGTVEFAGTVGSGAASGTLTVTNTGIGRVVELDTDDLPILPKGDFYEVWFVGPGDSKSNPNRISAGTFHPAPDGSSDVELTAAVDPKLYPELLITAEPGDGSPAPSGREVLRGGLD